MALRFPYNLLFLDTAISCIQNHPAVTPCSPRIIATGSARPCSRYSSVATKICPNTDCTNSHLVCFLPGPFTAAAPRQGSKLLPIHMAGMQPCVSPPCIFSTQGSRSTEVSFCNSATFQTCLKADECLPSFARAWAEPLGLNFVEVVKL